MCRDQVWCCLQFAAPKHVLTGPSKGWWEDVAFLMTHIGWKDRLEWPAILGQMTEYNLMRALGQRYTTLKINQAYVDIEKELGPDEEILKCPNYT